MAEATLNEAEEVSLEAHHDVLPMHTLSTCVPPVYVKAVTVVATTSGPFGTDTRHGYSSRCLTVSHLPC